jgi:uncharacterized protein YkwD
VLGTATRTRNRTGRLAIVAVVLAALAVVLSGCTPEQQAVLDRINATRNDAKLTQLLGSPHAMDKAQAWAEHLAQTGSLAHSNLTDGMPEGWTKLGENVGRGSSIDAVYDGFLRSPAHRANLVDPDYNWVGTGTAVAADGTVYVVEVFARY